MRRSQEYIPDRGDVVWLSFSPQAGHEQAGRRPAVAISPAVYNSRTGLALFCPITNQAKGYPFEVAIPNNLPVSGVAPGRSSQEPGLEGQKGGIHWPVAGRGACGLLWPR